LQIFCPRANLAAMTDAKNTRAKKTGSVKENPGKQGETRQDRLSSALRDNLRRRKQQSRERQDDTR